ncbi:hypothetical protein B0H17DRAFT_1147705 [Mycena rosella]|uniref:Uncharacterized protein n=1 Tax=Mycena rosella TaxID=1033263 RepID=A0AAD7G0G4_MYCRO|nr:hypothetical protein B0H17DRAFT_1147705 [Mycena rosella]
MPRNAKQRRWILKYIGDKYARHSLDSTMGATHMQGADKWYVSQRVALDTSEAMSSREVQVGAHVGGRIGYGRGLEMWKQCRILVGGWCGDMAWWWEERKCVVVPGRRRMKEAESCRNSRGSTF